MRRCGEIGRHKGLKIPRSNIRTGSSPVSGTNLSPANGVNTSFAGTLFYKIAFGLYLVFTNGTVKTIFYLRGSALATASIAAACAD